MTPNEEKQVYIQYSSHLREEISIKLREVAYKTRLSKAAIINEALRRLFKEYDANGGIIKFDE